MMISELTKKFKVVFAMFQLIEANVGLDGNSRAGIPEIWIIARHNRETLALRLPGEIRDGVLTMNQTKTQGKTIGNDL
jgi:hypothetical protein